MECISAARGYGSATLQRIPSAQLTDKITALAGFERVAEVALPPLIALVQMTDLYFVGFRMLREPVAKAEVSIHSHEIAELNIGITRVTSDDEHVRVVSDSR